MRRIYVTLLKFACLKCDRIWPKKASFVSQYKSLSLGCTNLKGYFYKLNNENKLNLPFGI